jgi:collagen type VI alpha
MYFPSLLVELNATQKDIVFLLDGSDDTRRDFAEMLSFVQKVTEALNVKETKDRVSVVQYSSDQQTHFDLGTYKGEQDVLAAIRQIQQKGGMPLNTGAALDYVRRNVFTESSGSRRLEGVPQILIVLSGGKSQDEVASSATALKLEQVIVFSIGSRNSDLLELQMMAHSPSYALTVPRFNDLMSIYQQLMSFVKRVPRQPKSMQKTGLGKRRFILPFTIFSTQHVNFMVYGK